MECVRVERERDGEIKLCCCQADSLYAAIQEARIPERDARGVPAFLIALNISRLELCA